MRSTNCSCVVGIDHVYTMEQTRSVILTPDIATYLTFSIIVLSLTTSNNEINRIFRSNTLVEVNIIASMLYTQLTTFNLIQRTLYTLSIQISS